MRYTKRARILRLTATVVAVLGLALNGTPIATAQQAGESIVQDTPVTHDAGSASETTEPDVAEATTESEQDISANDVPAEDAAGEAPPIPVARSPFRNTGGPRLGLHVQIESDGTATFDADDAAGNDSDAHNNIVRVNDTVTYRINYNVNDVVGENTTVKFTLPKGMEMTSVPGFCLAGSSLEPPTAGTPNLPLSANSVNELQEQTLTCKLGRKENATDNFPITAKVLNLVHNGAKLKPLLAELSADGSAPVTVAEQDLPEVTASARLKWDISKNGVAERDDTGYKYGPATEPCPWDVNRVCKRTGYSVLISAPAGGKGAMPAIGDITLKDDLSFRSMYKLTEEQYQKLEADPDKYGSRAYAYGSYYAIPGKKIGGTDSGVALTEKNSVRDAGQMTFDNTLKGVPVPLTISGADMSLRTYPTEATRPVKSAIPGDNAYAVAQPFSVYTPVDTITEVGKKVGNTWTLETVNRFTDLEIRGFTPQDRQTIADQYLGNDYRTTTPDVSFGARFNKAFGGVPGLPGNMAPNDFVPGYGSRGEGPPGGATMRSGGITVAPGQRVLSQLEVSGSSPELPGDVSILLCDSWDNTRLHLHSGDVPASTHGGVYHQAVPSEGAPVWISGYNNVLDGGNTRWARTASETPAIKVQYSPTQGGIGEASECGDAQGPWYDDPAAVPGNDPAELAQGVYTAVSRVRIQTVLPRPVSNSSIVGTGVRIAASIQQKVVDSKRPTGDMLPNWAAIKVVPGKELDLEGILNDPTAWTRTSYTLERHTGTSGDRLILADAQARIDKQVRKGDSGDFSDTPPQVSGGDAGGANQTPADRVDYKIVPSLTSGAMTPGVFRDVWVEDCLPSSQIYVGATVEPNVVSAGSTPPDAKRSACQANETYIRWEFPKHEVNVAFDPIILTTEVSPVATTGVYNNVVKIWAEGDASPEGVRTNDAQVQVANIAGVRLQKEALTPVVQVNRVGQVTNEPHKWRVRLLNTLPPAQSQNVQNPDVIDVLPKNTIAGTSFNGTFIFESATVTKGNKPGQDVRLLYTKAEDVQLDPNDPTNAANGSTAWCDSPTGGNVVIGTGDCPAAPAEVTGLRVQRPGAYGTGDVIEFDLDMVGVDNAGGDLYVNRVFGRAEGLPLPVGPITRSETTVESSIGDRTWWDTNRNGIQDDFAGAPEPGAADVPVRLEGVDDLGNPVSIDTTTNAQGEYSFPRLRASNDAGYTVTFNKDSNRKLTFTTKGSGAEDKDSNADPASGATDPVVLARNTANTTVDAGFVATGSLRVTKDLTGPGAAAFAPGNELEFQVRCTLDGRTVKEETIAMTVERGKNQLTSDPITEIPVGASCEVTETKTGAADPTADGQQPRVVTEIGFDNANGTGAAMTAAFTNRYSAGVLNIVKKLEGDDEPKAAAAQSQFTFEVTCQLPGATGADPVQTVLQKNVTVTGENTVTVNGDDDTPVQLPVGARCFATEVDDAGATTKTIDHDSYDNAVIVEANNEDQAGQLTINATNVFKYSYGELKVRKELFANGSTGQDTFTVEYTCNAKGLAVGSDDEIGETGRVQVRAGEETTIGRFPIGKTCRITAEDPAPRDGFTLTSELGQEVTLGDAPVVLHVTNTYTRDHGSFRVAKEVAGDGVDSLGDKTFEVDYTCGGQTGTLAVKAGQSVDGPRVPTGTECELVEKADSAQRGGGYTVASEFDKPRFTVVAKDEVVEVKLTNTYSRDHGSFSVVKEITGDDAAAAEVRDKVFRVNYTCGALTGTLDVKGNGEVATSPRIPTGTDCELTEDEASRQRDNYTADPAAFDNPRFTVADKDSVVPVKLTNRYTRDMASFTVAKSVTGDDADAVREQTFDFTYTCGEQTGTIQLKGDGVPVASPRIPTGTQCEIKEVDTKRTGYTVTAAIDKPNFILGAKDSVVEVQATNTYSRDHGTFSVRKNITGDDADAARGKEFTVHYVCGDQEADLKVPGNGDAVTGPKVPTGTECRLTEDAASAERDGYAVASQFDKPTFTVADKDSTVEVTLTNDYARDKGGFTLAKTVTGNAAGRAGKEFEFTYTCAGSEAKKVKVVPGEVTQITDIPTGECTIEETDAAVDNTDYTSALAVDGGDPTPGRSVTINVAKGKTVEVKATNDYSTHMGSFEVVKTAESDDDKAAEITQGKEFTFSYACEPAYEGAPRFAGDLKVAADGKPVAGLAMPTGTECSVKEQEASAKVDGYDVTLPEEATFTIGAKDSVHKVEAKNVYKRHTGTFSLAKRVNGAKEFEKDTFHFNYICTNNVNGALEVKGDGNAVDSKVVLPVGTQCQVTEDENKAERPDYTLQAAGQMEVNITTKGQKVELVATNNYTKITPPPTSPTMPPAPKIPGGGSGETLPKQGAEESTQPSVAAGTTPPTGAKESAEKPKRTLAKTGVSDNLAVIAMLAALLITVGVGSIVMTRRR